MQQIMEIASSMGFQQSMENMKSEQPPVQDVFNKMVKVLRNTENKGSKQQTLVRALLPYLSPKRKAKLERAMQISHLSRLAGTALQQNLTNEPEEEESHV